LNDDAGFNRVLNLIGKSHLILRYKERHILINTKNSKNRHIYMYLAPLDDKPQIATVSESELKTIGSNR